MNFLKRIEDKKREKERENKNEELETKRYIGAATCTHTTSIEWIRAMLLLTYTTRLPLRNCMYLYTGELVLARLVGVPLSLMPILPSSTNSFPQVILPLHVCTPNSTKLQLRISWERILLTWSNLKSLQN